MPPLSEWSAILRSPEFALGLLGGVLASLFLLLLFRLARRRQPETVAAFENDAGHVVVSRKALQEQIQAFCEATPEVANASVRVKGQHDVLSIIIRLKLKGDAHLTGVSSELQERTRTFLKSNLGIENLGAIDILVSGIIPTSSQTMKATRLHPDDRED